MIALCVQDCQGTLKPKKHEQRLLRNMGAHSVVLELLQIPYDKVCTAFSLIFFSPVILNGNEVHAGAIELIILALDISGI